MGKNGKKIKENVIKLIRINLNRVKIQINQSNMNIN